MHVPARRNLGAAPDIGPQERTGVVLRGPCGSVTMCPYVSVRSLGASYPCATLQSPRVS
jgi:hypothetical protein